jgi:hypothetical protein
MKTRLFALMSTYGGGDGRPGRCVALALACAGRGRQCPTGAARHAAVGATRRRAPLVRTGALRSGAGACRGRRTLDSDADHLIRTARVKRAVAVLYLDFDGVLHTEHVYYHHKRGIYIDQDRAPGRTLFEWTFHLEDALAAAPDVKLVLSTTWAQRPGFCKACQRLPESLRRRVIGATFHRRVHGANPWVLQSFREMSRGLQVWADVKRRMPEAWAALDDDDFGWPAWCRDTLIVCRGDVGLSDESTRTELARHLSRLQAVAGSFRE